MTDTSFLENKSSMLKFLNNLKADTLILAKCNFIVTKLYLNYLFVNLSTICYLKYKSFSLRTLTAKLRGRSLLNTFARFLAPIA